MEVLQMTPLCEADLLLVIYVLMDDWFRDKGKALLQATWGASRPGPERGSGSLTLSETLTLLVAMDLMNFDCERKFLAHLGANHSTLWSAALPEHSWFNRQGRDLSFLLESFRQALAGDLGIWEENVFLLDTTPVEVVAYNRSKKKSDFAGSAALGYCASQKKRYFGYKLVVLSSLNGIPAAFDAVPANMDEREAAQAVLPFLTSPERLEWRASKGLAAGDGPEATIIGDKGFIGEDWAREQRRTYGAAIATPRRSNQHVQWPAGVNKALNRARQRVETLNGMLKNGARNVGRTLAKTVQGLASRLVARFAALTVRFWLKKFWGVDTANLLWDCDPAV
jgi:hypothetical protein